MYIKNASWDLVDAIKEEPQAIQNLKEDDLNDEMKKNECNRKNSICKEKSSR